MKSRGKPGGLPRGPLQLFPILAPVRTTVRPAAVQPTKYATTPRSSRGCRMPDMGGQDGDGRRLVQDVDAGRSIRRALAAAGIERSMIRAGTRGLRSKSLDAEKAGHAFVAVDALNRLSKQGSNAKHGDGNAVGIHRSRVRGDQFIDQPSLQAIDRHLV